MHPHPPLFRFFGVLAACLPFLPFMNGCGLPSMMLGHFEPPEVSLSASKVESLTVDTAVVQLLLMVHNPNPFSLHTSAVRYRLSLGGHVLAAGSHPSSVTVPPREAATVDIPVEVPFTAINEATPDGIMLGEIPYDLDGTLFVGSLVSTHDVPFAASSVLRVNVPLELASLPRLPSLPEAGTRTHVIDSHVVDAHVINR